MMNREQILECGRMFYEAGKTRCQIDPPSHVYPQISYEDAYAIQRVTVDRMQMAGMTPVGKKVGLTSDAMRRLSNIHEPDYGFIFQELGYPNQAELPVERFIAPRIECELIFKLGQTLDRQKITREDVLDATDYIVCGLEIVDYRMFREKYQRVVQDSIADNAAFGAYVLGDVPLRPYQVDLSLTPYIFEVNGRQAEVSCGAAVCGDPALAVAWLANRFMELGSPLKAGELILSGSAVASLPVRAGDHFRCRFGPFGEAGCLFV